MDESAAAHGNHTVGALLRHFMDLREGTHGGAAPRQDKERLFGEAVGLIGPYVRQALEEVDQTLLLNTGIVHESGMTRTPDGGLASSWTLSWPEQRAADVEPIIVEAHFGRG